MNFWNNKKILLTGGAGFLGNHVFEKLKERGVKEENIEIPQSKNCDLREKENCKKVVKNKDIVIHTAGRTGGIGDCRAHPGEFFYMIAESWRYT